MNTQETGSDVLHEYARLKLDLATIVRSLLHKAEQSKDDLSIAECRRVLARLAEDRFNLAIVGQFSRGKSSLMNALLGAEKLPTGILPLTSVITTVTYGEREKVLIQREGWAFPQEIPLNQLQKFVTQSRNPGNEKRVVLAEVQLPNELLRLGVHFVDTPGIASAITANTRTTRQFLPEIDAAILVTSFESPMTETEVKFLREVREHVRTVFIVVNKLDLATEVDREGVLTAVRGAVGNEFSDSRPEVFAVSARLALQAKQNDSRAELAKSGFPALEEALLEFLRTGKARDFFLRAAERTTQIVHQQEIAIRISRRANDGNSAASLRARLEEFSRSLTHDLEEMIVAIHRQLPREFREVSATAAPLWTSEAEAQVASRLGDWFSNERGEISGKPFQDYLQQTLQRLFSDWVSQNREQIEKTFRELTLREMDGIEPFAARVAGLPASILGEQTEASLRLSNTISLSFRDLTASFANFEVPWWYDLLPSGGWRNFVGRRWSRRAPELGALYRRATDKLLETAMNDWIDTIDRELRTRIERTTAHVKKLLEQKPQLNELADLEGLTDRLQQFMKTVLRMGDGSSHDTSASFAQPRAVENSTAIPPCRVCIRIEKALKDFMARRQYELSVNERDQRNHALQSGFCPLHTWQYEAIASPQGVCSSYAELMSLFAKKLRSLAREGNSVENMESGVRTMLPTPLSCAACQLVAATEEAAARDLARQLNDGGSSRAEVCAFHLGSVLIAGVSTKEGIILLLKEASSFERIAENMQNHILKHEAIRHHLSTSAERDAAETGLAHLVGRRDTVTPWRID